MTQGLNAIVFTGSSRRIRVICTGPLAMSAFTSTSFYSVTNTDGAGAATINVVAVFAISSNSNAFELAIDSDLTDGAQYQVAVTALPFADLSTLTASILGATASQANAPIPNTEPGANDFEMYLYSRDLAQADSGDLAEDATGDLTTITGRDNWFNAQQRAVISDGILWNPNYGGKLSEFVNAPGIFALPVSAVAVSQCRADDRTASAICGIVADLGGVPGVYFFQLTITPIDGLDPQTFQVPLPILLSS